MSGAAGHNRSVWSRFKKNPSAIAGLVLVGVMFALALGADLVANHKPYVLHLKGQTYYPMFQSDPEFDGVQDFKTLVPTFAEGDWALFPLVPYGRDETNPANRLMAPSSAHWMGTTEVGHDVLGRLIHGARVSLFVGLIAVGVSVVIGIMLGGVSGYLGGWADAVVMRLTEIVICFPPLYLILAVLAVLPPSIINIMLVLGFTRWTGIARLLRGEVMKLRDREFVLAAKVLGASGFRVLTRHIFPNAMAPVLVAATFGVANAILLESALSFLGLGVQPPTPSWGEMLDQGRRNVSFAYWLVLFPGALVFVTVTAYNLLGEGLRDAVDPQQIR
jgi:peptide/nickel transport system permease protein